MAQIDSKTQTLLSIKLEAYFRKFEGIGIFNQMKSYNQTKPLGYEANTVWRVMKKKKVKAKTAIDLLIALGLQWDRVAYENDNVIKHVENEAPKDKVCEGCKGCTYYQHEYHNCQGQEKICHEYSKFGK